MGGPPESDAGAGADDSPEAASEVIEIRRGDLLEAEVEALVNPVNCVGVMGRGLALAFRTRFPDNFEAYAACRRGAVVPGEMFVFGTGRPQPRWIVNFPTKRHWRERSRMDDLARGLSSLTDTIREREIRSLALRALGCGLGGLEWRAVRARIEAALAPFAEVRTLLYEPRGIPAGPARPTAGEAGAGRPAS